MILRLSSLPRTGATRSLALVATLAASLGIARAQTPVTLTDNTPGYFDNSSGIRSFIVTPGDMAGGTAVNQVTISIDFEKFDGETFGVNGGDQPFYNEIELLLTNPQNVTTSLIASGSFDSGSVGFRGVITFDDATPTVVNADFDSPHAGTFRPTGSGTMASLNSLDGVGTWTLGIADTVANDHLGYYSATLNLNVLSVVPEAGTLSLLAAGVLPLIGLAVRKRMR